MLNFGTILNELPTGAEVAERADILFQISALTDDCSLEQKNYLRYFWETGSGDEWTAIIGADGENSDSILLFAYDHESHFNHYGNNPEEQNVFDGIPESFKYLLDEDNLKWSWDTDDGKIIYATAAAWLESGATAWHASEKFMAEVEEKDEDGGFIASFRFFLTSKFDLETFIMVENQADVEDKVYSDEDREFLSKVFDK